MCACAPQVDLSNNRLGDEGAKALAPAIRDSRSLTECTLRGNHLGVEGWSIIFNALRESTTSGITNWDLSNELEPGGNRQLGSAIGKPLADYISVSRSLTQVCPIHNLFLRLTAVIA